MKSSLAIKVLQRECCCFVIWTISNTVISLLALSSFSYRPYSLMVAVLFLFCYCAN